MVPLALTHYRRSLLRTFSNRCDFADKRDQVQLVEERQESAVSSADDTRVISEELSHVSRRAANSYEPKLR